MTHESIPSSGVEIKAWTVGVPFEEKAREQARNLSALPFVFPHIAIMPDVHWGYGATVGSVIPTRGAIVPAALGVDLGCGMQASRTSLTANDLPDSLAELRSAIEAAVPHGGPGVTGSWEQHGGVSPSAVVDEWIGMQAGWDLIRAKHPKIDRGMTYQQLGTLGTGNHFVEICLDKEDRVWVMLHSGSRGVGNRIGTYFIERAREHLGDRLGALPDKDLAWLDEGTPAFADYVEAVAWAQSYAARSRVLMMGATLRAIRSTLGRPFRVEDERISCHHNYVSREHHFGADVWVTRKGAVSARAGELGIIPGSMGTRSYIVRGKGNADSLHSCSHGAGRVMSRGEAKRKISLEDHAKATAGVECRKDADVLDESPAAYKSIDHVMAAQVDLVDVVHELKAVLCVKG